MLFLSVKKKPAVTFEEVKDETKAALPAIERVETEVDDSNNSSKSKKLKVANTRRTAEVTDT
jgi:hypothetical protein